MSSHLFSRQKVTQPNQNAYRETGLVGWVNRGEKVTQPNPPTYPVNIQKSKKMDIAQQVKEAANILDVVSHYVILKKSGSRYMAVCPFHNERTPSFYVTPTMNMYKCFGCGERGDAISFVMKFKNIPFLDAVKEIAGMYNIAPNMFPVSKSLSARKQETFKKQPEAAQIPPSFIPKEKVLETLKSYEKNNFVQFLITWFGKDVAEQLTADYYIGTSNHWPGANVFWQIDKNGGCRSGKVMQYDAATGKRDRSIDPTWMHSILGIQSFVLSQCLFGEHLAQERPNTKVCIVESEKTAIIASAYLPECVWLACGGKTMLTAGKMRAIKGRRIVLYPDAGLPDKSGKTPFETWSDFAADMVKDGYNVTVSDLIERKATQEERASGYDLADYLLGWSLSEFQEMAAPAPIDTKPQPTPNLPPPGTWERFDGQINEPFEQIMTADDYPPYPAVWDEPGPPDEAIKNCIRPIQHTKQNQDS